ncbi:MAG: hypothetical protein NTY53_21930 [Kiritimatiellaeota bacterium]|nr:hypothetical protein [Kiritimatiellota bacterium]
MGDIVTSEQSAAAMAGFIGHYVHALDGKKRLTIPSEWRTLTGDPAQLIVLPSVSDSEAEQCLWVYPVREWNLRLSRLRQVSSADESVRRAMRVLASRSEMLTWDAAGRLRVRDELLKHAGLTGQVMLVGGFERFELWEPEQWKLQEGAVDSTAMKKAVQSIGL